MVYKIKSLFKILNRRFPGFDSKNNSEKAYADYFKIYSHSDVSYLSLYSMLETELWRMKIEILEEVSNEQKTYLNEFINSFLKDNERIIKRECNEKI